MLKGNISSYWGCTKKWQCGAGQSKGSVDIFSLFLFWFGFWGGVRGGDRERESEADSTLSVWSPTQGRISRPWNHDLNGNQEDTQLTEPSRRSNRLTTSLKCNAYNLMCVEITVNENTTSMSMDFSWNSKEIQLEQCGPCLWELTLPQLEQKTAHTQGLQSFLKKPARIRWKGFSIKVAGSSLVFWAAGVLPGEENDTAGRDKKHRCMNKEHIMFF